ncbi:MAG: TetR/AcrR family transcriptional regulator, partial [Candidatus Angelobacter sp.]
MASTLAPLAAKNSSRRGRRSAELRERLFRAALEMFAKKGFLETTVEDITNAADVGKGTFFNYFPSKDHILLAFGEMQLGKLQRAMDEARKLSMPLPDFLRSLGTKMTEEPIRHPAIVRAFLQAYLSSTPVRAAMLELQNRVLALHSQMIQLGQERGEIREDLPPTEIAQVFRQTIFGTLLLWSLSGDGSLQTRIEAAFELLWSGLRPRTTKKPVCAAPL